MGKVVTGLSWGERFGLIDTYKPTDEQAVSAFGLQNVGELETARELRSEGHFAIPTDFDAETYGDIFASISENATSVKRPTTKKTEPESATKPERAPKKRGRKGTKINDAFAAITTDPVPAEEFATERGVSLNVLRQAKRFDRTGGARVRVKKIDGTLMVFRESE